MAPQPVNVIEVYARLHRGEITPEQAADLLERPTYWAEFRQYWKGVWSWWKRLLLKCVRGKAA